MPAYPGRRGARRRPKRSCKSFPPLVFAGEARELKSQLAEVARGEAFLLQGGDCAESFAEHGADHIRDFFRVFLQMAVVLTHGASASRWSRSAASPASSPSRARPTPRPSMASSCRAIAATSSTTSPSRPRRARPDPRAPADGLPAVGGDAQPAARLRHRRLCRPDPRPRMDHGVHEGLDRPTPRFEAVASKIDDAIEFMRALGLTPDNTPSLRETKFYTSHEALLLGYEEALTRRDSITGDWYATSGHMLWIGDRTRQPDAAHVEYFSGIKNPIGIKCGPSLEQRRSAAAARQAQPRRRGRPHHADRPLRRRQGRGASAAADRGGAAGRAHAWSGAPTRCTATPSRPRRATRPAPSTRCWPRCKSFFEVHRSMGTYAGGIHVEMTGDDVTECVGGVSAVTEASLSDRYHTYCDPRLNASQALELAFLVAEEVHAQRPARPVARQSAFGVATRLSEDCDL